MSDSQDQGFIDNQDYEDDISLKDILSIVKEYISEIISNWKWLLIIPLIPAAIMFFIAWNEKPNYVGSVIFTVNVSEGNTGGIKGLLKSLTGGGRDGNLEKILQLFNTRRIITKSLFDKVIVDGKEDFIANHLLRIYTYKHLAEPFNQNVSWMQSASAIDSFYFEREFVDSIATGFEKSVNKILYSHLGGNETLGIESMIQSAVDEHSGIMQISVSTISEDLTIQLSRVLYENLSEYYIENTVEKQKRFFELAKFKKDSLERELLIADRKRAEFRDKNRNLVWVTGELEMDKLRRKASILEMMYGSVVRQLEDADWALRERTPYVSFIDLPTKPLTPIITSKFFNTIIGFVLGFVLTIVFLIVRKVVRDELNKTTD